MPDKIDVRSIVYSGSIVMEEMYHHTIRQTSNPLFIAEALWYTILHLN